MCSRWRTCAEGVCGILHETGCAEEKRVCGSCTWMCGSGFHDSDPVAYRQAKRLLGGCDFGPVPVSTLPLSSRYSIACFSSFLRCSKLVGCNGLASSRAAKTWGAKLRAVSL